MPKDQPDVPIGHRSEEFYQEDLRQQNLAKAFSIPERSLTIKPSTYRCKFCDVFSSSQVTFNEHPWLRCDTRFQCAFTACGHIFKVILWLKPTNVITLKMQSHAENACRNAALFHFTLITLKRLNLHFCYTFLNCHTITSKTKPFQL
jgi:hypothetical protein